MAADRQDLRRYARLELHNAHRGRNGGGRTTRDTRSIKEPTTKKRRTRLAPPCDFTWAFSGFLVPLALLAVCFRLDLPLHLQVGVSTLP